MIIEYDGNIKNTIKKNIYMYFSCFAGNFEIRFNYRYSIIIIIYYL